MELLQTLINGTLTGAVYGVVALSFVVIYRASKIVNLAQGQVIIALFIGREFQYYFSLQARTVITISHLMMPIKLIL